MSKTILLAALVLASCRVEAQEPRFTRYFSSFADVCMQADEAGARTFDDCMEYAELQVSAIVDQLSYISPRLSAMCEEQSRNIFDTAECLIEIHELTNKR